MTHTFEGVKRFIFAGSDSNIDLTPEEIELYERPVALALIDLGMTQERDVDSVLSNGEMTDLLTFSGEVENTVILNKVCEDLSIPREEK